MNQDESPGWVRSDRGLIREPLPYNFKTVAEEEWFRGVLSSLATNVLALPKVESFRQALTTDPSIDDIEALCRSVNVPYGRVAETIHLALLADLRGYSETTIWTQPEQAPARLRVSLVEILRLAAEAIETNPAVLDVPWPHMEQRVKEIFSNLSLAAQIATAAALNIDKGRRRSDLNSSAKRTAKTPSPQRIGETLFRLWCEGASRYSLAKALFLEGRFQDVASASKRIKEWESKAQRLLIPLGS